MPKLTRLAASSLITYLTFSVCLIGTATAAEPASFEIRKLAVDANEGIASADVNGDGKIDLVAGRFWYQNPEWVPRPLRAIEDWNGYVQSNGDYIFDVNKDGKPDVVAGSFAPSEVYWYQNPGERGLRLGQEWAKFLFVDTGQQRNEGILFEDVDGDGQAEWVANSWSKDVPMYVCRLLPKEPEAAPKPAKGKNKQPVNTAAYKLVPTMIGESGNGHGLGIGDINGDGRKDILVGQGWYEHPESNLWEQKWKFHKVWELHASLPMLIVDVNGDGKNDLIHGKGHDYGLMWWENQGAGDDGELQFKEHLIDREFSQPHSLAWADVTGDGKPDLITGKRYYAHNGRDAGGEEVPCLYYYTLDVNSAKFTRHTIDEGNVGTGLQIVVEDFNGDGRNDIAVAGKSGTHLLLNRSK